MKFMMRIIPILLLCVLFVGCFEVETVVRVKRDGSGSVHERIVINSDMMLMIMRMAKRMKGEEGKEGSPLFDEEALLKKASAMGEGVTYRTGTVISGDDGEGYEATYEFKDINMLRISMTPDLQPEGMDGMMDNMEQNQEPAEKKEELRFEFHKGSPATLVIHTPPVNRNREKEQQGEEAEEDTEHGMEMMRSTLKNLRISAMVEIDGTVVESDATFRERSKIILTDIDFGKLTEDENLIRAAMKADRLSDEEAKELMKKYPGLKIEMNAKTTTKFR